MVSFNVGPSKLFPQVAQYLQDAYHEHIMSMSHRSADFVAISQNVIKLLHQKLNIPEEYTIFYTSSATECWEILAQDVCKQSVHYYNGDFGKKWAEYTKNINTATQIMSFEANTTLDARKYLYNDTVDMLAITRNETSTGTQVKDETILNLKTLYPNALVALDCTSCMGGIDVNAQLYDILFASVQKCFGLPAGLGIMICSPKTIEKAQKINQKNRYNSLLNMLDKIKDYQTTYTPNVLNIYLLGRVLEKMPNIKIVQNELLKNAEMWYQYFEMHQILKTYITNHEVKSDTVITVIGEEQIISKAKKIAKENHFELGSGYGTLKNNTFRIANFPAISQDEIIGLKSVLSNIVS